MADQSSSGGSQYPPCDDQTPRPRFGEDSPFGGELVENYGPGHAVVDKEHTEITGQNHQAPHAPVAPPPLDIVAAAEEQFFYLDHLFAAAEEEEEEEAHKHNITADDRFYLRVEESAPADEGKENVGVDLAERRRQRAAEKRLKRAAKTTAEVDHHHDGSSARSRERHGKPYRRAMRAKDFMRVGLAVHGTVELHPDDE